MAQAINIIAFFSVAGALLIVPGASASSNSEFLAAYGRAEAAYTGWLAENIRSGRRPSVQERRTKHKELFKEAQEAYVKEVRAMEDKMRSLGRTFIRDVKSHTPPAPPPLSEELKKSLDEKPLQSADEPAKNSKSLAKKLESSGKTNERESSTRVAPTIGDVKAGAAEAVSFKSAITPGETGSAGVVSFSAPTGKRGTASNEGHGSAEAVSFSKPGTPPATTQQPGTK